MRIRVVLLLAMPLIAACDDKIQRGDAVSAARTTEASRERRTKLLEAAEAIVEADPEKPSTSHQIGYARRLKAPVANREHLRRAFGSPDREGASNLAGHTELDWRDPVEGGPLLSMLLDADGYLKAVTIYRSRDEWEIISSSGKYWIGFPSGKK